MDKNQTNQHNFENFKVRKQSDCYQTVVKHIRFINSRNSVPKTTLQLKAERLAKENNGSNKK